ncbi:LysM domain-containing GPI-anchored protein 1 [Spatholobus suberectus]|nr:LysM domain-containing GPI-anchored protein 1 [Spatholobus suberectus]
MPNQNPILHCTFLLLLLHVLLNAALMSCKSTIEPCSNNDSCNVFLGYTLYTDLKVSQVASLFQIDLIALLTANAIDISSTDVEHHILPSKLFLKVPITCSCVDGIRKSVSTHYRTRPSDTLSSIADSIYGGLVSPDQLKEANSIVDPSVLDVGLNLEVPLPCTCFNGSDNSLPSIYLSYVVQPIDTLAAIATRYFTTLTDLMNVNDMGTTAISDGDILAVLIPACASNFPEHASDFGLLVPNGSYAITASHCVKCSCEPRNFNLYCMPASLLVSCSSMQCKNNNLMLGNATVQQSSSGCNVVPISTASLSSLDDFSYVLSHDKLTVYEPNLLGLVAKARGIGICFVAIPIAITVTSIRRNWSNSTQIFSRTCNWDRFRDSHMQMALLVGLLLVLLLAPSLVNPLPVLTFAFMLLLVKLMILVAL